MRAIFIAAAALTTLAGTPRAALAEEPVSSPEPVSSLGEAVTAENLDELRGGDENYTDNVIVITGEVTDNSANDVVTGANQIQNGSFSNASGITSVVQNTGANVLIQSATILNVQFAEPAQ